MGVRKGLGGCGCGGWVGVLVGYRLGIIFEVEVGLLVGVGNGMWWVC